MPIDVVLLTGFLGSGKTTLLKRILSWTGDLSGVVVVVNEFGEVGLDGKLLEDAETNVIEMTSGCICCSLKADLFITLTDIAGLAPRLVLIEATGVAKPRQTAEVLLDHRLADLYRLTNTITVFDLELWEAREAMGSLFRDQLTQANLILANKIDVLSNEKAHRFLVEMQREFPGKVIVPATFCDIEPALVFTPQPPITNEDLPALTHHHQEDALFQSFVFTSPEPVSEACLKSFLSAAPKDLFRIKGFVRTGRETYFLNFAQGRADWQPGENAGETQLVLIGQNLDEDRILDDLHQCVKSNDQRG